jgi:hypothetical protein
MGKLSGDTLVIYVRLKHDSLVLEIDGGHPPTRVADRASNCCTGISIPMWKVPSARRRQLESENPLNSIERGHAC